MWNIQELHRDTLLKFKYLLWRAQGLARNPPESCTGIEGETENKIQLANSSKEKGGVW